MSASQTDLGQPGLASQGGGGFCKKPFNYCADICKDLGFMASFGKCNSSCERNFNDVESVLLDYCDTGIC